MVCPSDGTIAEWQTYLWNWHHSGVALNCHWPSRNPSSDRTTNFGVIINIVGRHNQASWICFFVVFGWTTKTPGCEEVLRGLFPTNVTICLLLGFSQHSRLLPSPPPPSPPPSPRPPPHMLLGASDLSPLVDHRELIRGLFLVRLVDASLTQDKRNPEFYLFNYANTNRVRRSACVDTHLSATLLVRLAELQQKESQLPFSCCNLILKKAVKMQGQRH